MNTKILDYLCEYDYCICIRELIVVKIYVMFGKWEYLSYCITKFVFYYLVVHVVTDLPTE